MQTVGAREIESRARELRGQSVAFQRRWNFRMKKDHPVRSQAIGEKRMKSIYRRLEPVSFLVVCYQDVIQIQFHCFPRTFGGLLAANSIRNCCEDGRPQNAVATEGNELRASRVRWLVLEKPG